MPENTKNNAQAAESGTVDSTARRRLLMGAGAAAVAVAAGNSAFAATGHEHHHPGGGANEGVIDSSLACVKTGQACLDHCIELFKQGDTSVAECADTVQEMLAACTALSQLASANSRHLGAMAKVCIGICEDCEKACREHEDKHPACKACADACKTCIDECKKVAA